MKDKYNDLDYSIHDEDKEEAREEIIKYAILSIMSIAAWLVLMAILFL